MTSNDQQRNDQQPNDRSSNAATGRAAVRATGVKVVALAAVFAVSLGAAFGLARRTDEPTASATSTSTASDSERPAPVPVLAPLAVDVDPAQIADTPGGAGGEGVAVSPVVSMQPASMVARRPIDADSSPDDLAASMLDAFAPALTRDAGRAKPDGDGESEPDVPSGDDVGVGVFVDPCAGDSPAEARDDAECAEGVGSTVLAIRAPAAMETVLFLDPAHIDAANPGWRRCDYPSGDGIPAVVLTNNPVDEGFVSFHDVYDIAATRDQFDLAPTSEAERRRWESTPTYPEDWWEGPQHCLRVPLAGAPGTQWSITAWTDGIGGDDFDNSGWTIPDSRTRPPVSIRFDGANHVRVIAPVQSNGMTVAASAIPFGPAGSGSCATHETNETEATAETSSERRVHPAERLDADTLASPDYPYLPAYNAMKQVVLELDEGTYYHLCVRWYRQAASFDSAGIVDREAYFIATPDRRRATFRVVGHEFVRAVGPDRVSVAVVEPDRSSPLQLASSGSWTGACSASLPNGVSYRGGSRTVLAEPLALCSTEGHVDDLLVYPEVDIVTSVRDGASQRVRIPLDLKSEGTRSELYRIPLSGERRLCGTGPFSGGCGANRDDFGAITLEVVYSEGRRTGQYDGFVGAPTEWTGPASERPEPGPDVQLDHFDDYVTDASGNIVGIAARTFTMPVTDRTDALELVLVADRNADVHVQVHPAPERELCLTSGDGSATGRAFARTRSPIVITGLCARTHYRLEVTMTADNGRVTRFGPEATSGWNYAQTYGWQAEWGVHARILEYPGSDDIAMLHGDVLVDARPIDLREAGPNDGENHNLCFAGRLRSIHRNGHRGFYGDAVTFDVRVALGDYVPPVSNYWRENFNRCVHRGFGRDPRFNEVTDSLTVPTEELFDGDFTRRLDDGNGLVVEIRILPRRLDVGSGYDYPDDRWRR